VQVTVTGGAGFIGANLCRRLAANPDIERVIAFDDLSTGSVANLDGVDVELVEGTIADPDALATACEGSATIVHLGARPSVPRSIQDPVASHDVNVTGTVNVLEVARHHGGLHVVVASSSSVYGANPELPKHEGLAPMPASPYAASKLAAESYALAYQRSFGLPTLALRFFNVFGPLQPAGHAYAAVIPAFVDAALAGRPLPVHGDGTQSRDFTFVDTVVELLARATTERTTADQPVNLAFGTRTDLLTVIALLEDVLGRPLEVEHLPPRAGDVAHSQADSTALRRLFPDVDATDLRAGLVRTVDWMRSTAG
jgi:UDP-glucose 4-epimerase